MLVTARGNRLLRISRIAQAYRDNLNNQLDGKMDWWTKVRTPMTYGARIGDPLDRWKSPELASKGNSNG